jgi:glutathione synthase/RimK-type ligase-like ATP-grasp enzyme
VTSRIAIATCLSLPVGDGDDQPLVDVLRRRGFEVHFVPWDQPDVEWSSFDATVIRATWNYTAHREQFLAWAASVPRLYNPADVVVPNSDKTYLAGLAAAGLPVVATHFAEPGTQPEFPASGEFVVKPSVGAGSRGVGRFDARRPGALLQAREHADALHEAGRTVLVQPYQAGVDSAGESALIFLDGKFSHAIRKGPMLTPEARHRVDDEGLYLLENITPRQPSIAELTVAERVFAHVNADLEQTLLYARIDLLPGPNGPVLVELELIEPSLFLSYCDGSADLLADAISNRVS